jgi:ABC-2 type transport system ATP-binding protein
MRQAEPALRAKALGRRYGKQWALQECSLGLPAGRVVALVGPNGAGKTTLLHLAVGLLEPTEGTIEVLGATPAEDSGLLSRVGFVAQDVPLYRSFTVSDMLALGAHLNTRWDQRLAEGRLAQAGVPLDKRIGALSGGQRAQVSLALAVAKRPELLLLDEPLASLDPLARREFLQALMETVAEEGATVVLSSHLIQDLERVCDFLVVLAGGRVQVADEIEDLRAAHRVLVGPRREETSVAGVEAVVHERRTDRQTSILARLDGPVIDPSWSVHEVDLEEIVLGYLSVAAGSPRPAGGSSRPTSGPRQTRTEVGA